MVAPSGHDHVFLGEGHDRNARKTRTVIALCTVVMAIEIAGGVHFGSLALIADGLHMSTHAAAMLIAALAYGYARRHARDARFSFGTGKVGDLAGFSSAVILAMIALLIGYEAVARLLHPVRIDFDQAIGIAFLGLAVNVLSAWLLSDGGHVHHHGHDHAHDHAHDPGPGLASSTRLGAGAAVVHVVEPTGHAHGAHHRDHNMRAAFVHVAADAAVSILAILGLAAGKYFGLVFMDPVMGIVGALVIANWSFGLVRDTGAILLDMNPDPSLDRAISDLVAAQGDELRDLHLWRLGPGHLGAIVAVHSRDAARDVSHYRRLLGRFGDLSHVTVEVTWPRPG